MPDAFLDRFVEYFQKVAEVLKGEAGVASVFPNPTDVGTSREKIYGQFLVRHLPSFCNVIYGGFLFNIDGLESKQIDIIITSAFAPQYNFFVENGSGKSFVYVDSSLAVVEVKSSLNKDTLESSLHGFASIPQHLPMTNDRVYLRVNGADYENWPLKVLFACDGLSCDTIFGHLKAFYTEHPKIPPNRRPDLIHVLGKYYIWRPGSSPIKSREGRVIPAYTYTHSDRSVDIMSFVFAIHGIQLRTEASKFFVLSYHDFLNRIPV